MTGAEVGPDGTVGAWRLLILNGKPITVRKKGVTTGASLGANELAVELPDGISRQH